MAGPIHAASGTGDVQMLAESQGTDHICSFSAHESGAVATAASFILRDGTDGTGTPVIFVELAGDASINISYGEPIRFMNGVFLDRTSGTTEVTVHVR